MGCHGQGLVFLIGAVFALASCLNRAFRCRAVAVLAVVVRQHHHQATRRRGVQHAHLAAPVGPSQQGAAGRWLGRFGLGRK